ARASPTLDAIVRTTIGAIRSVRRCRPRRRRTGASSGGGCGEVPWGPPAGADVAGRDASGSRATARVWHLGRVGSGRGWTTAAPKPDLAGGRLQPRRATATTRPAPPLGSGHRNRDIQGVCPMRGLMQDVPLVLPHLFERAERFYF